MKSIRVVLFTQGHRETTAAIRDRIKLVLKPHFEPGDCLVSAQCEGQIKIEYMFKPPSRLDDLLGILKGLGISDHAMILDEQDQWSHIRLAQEVAA